MPTHLVTGATDGIGKQTALELGRLGATVLVHGRNQNKAAHACAELRKALPQARFEPVSADLSSLAEVRALAERIGAAHPALDVLVNNAGVFMTEKRLSPEGFELTMAINHFAPFVLTHRLLPLLKKAAKARVVNVSSVAHARGAVRLDDLDFSRAGFEGYRAYASSKLANVLFTHELARRLAGTGVTVNALHPGVIRTKLLAIGFGATGASLESGAVTSVTCATSPELEQVTGRYFADGRESKVSREANDPALEKAFYELSARLTGEPVLAAL